MKNIKQVLLIAGCIAGAFLGGYLAAVADISIPLTGHDLTGMAGFEDNDPREITGEDYLPLAIHMTLGISLLSFALISILKMRRRTPIKGKEKFIVFSLVFGLSWILLGLLACWISPETWGPQKALIKYWLAGLLLLLIFYTIKIIFFSKKTR